MLLIETLHVNDNTLRQSLHLPAPPTMPQPILGRVQDGLRRSARLMIKCMGGVQFSLTSNSAPKLRLATEIHFDRRLSSGEGHSQLHVYSSTRSRLVIKLATTGNGDLVNEKTAYERLTRFRQLLRVVPRYYGAYSWYGGRALVLSDEGPSLATLGVAFASLPPTER
jgi:hypothetical protein